MRVAQITLASAATNASTVFPFDVTDQWFNVTVTANFTDAATAGTLKLQGSCDPKTNMIAENNNPVNWVDIPSASMTIAGATSAVVEKPYVNYMYLRAVWTRTAGAGTMNVNLKGQAY